jgi:alpha/beta superfamily hydrolase
VARRIESHLLDGPSGKLEALLEPPEDREPLEACVVCHPHPLFGGTMHNKVVHRIARGLRRRGSVVLRFNFRGVGRSEGEHAGGIGEIDDARAALDWLRRRYPDLPYSLAGFSFGSRVILQLGCELHRAVRLLAVGFPVKSQTSYLSSCTVPKFFVTSTGDQYAPRDPMEALYASIAEPKSMIWIDAEDHFFAGALDRLEETIFSLG